jgi:iron complex outermembrane receptor protein
MHKFYAFFIVSFLYVSGVVPDAHSSLFAQTRKDTTQRVTLDSVTITTDTRRAPLPGRIFAVGSHVISSTSASIAESAMSSLADFFKAESAVYLKEYGKGMSSFISVRGTSSSHTTVSWNGMSLAIPTMGQTDLSHVPVYFFDRMDLHIGGNSTLYGDGSIGGNISLGTKPLWKEGVSGDLTLSAGSYASLFTGATLRYANSKTESRTSLFRASATNRFAFENNTKIGKPIEYLNNAGYENYGALQEIYRKTGKNSLLNFNLWYLDFSREIQPSVALNDRPETYASIFDKNFRTSLSFSGEGSTISYAARLSYAYDHERYKEDLIAASRFLASAEAGYSTPSGKINIKGGLSAEHIVPNVDSYADSVTEQRSYIYLLARAVPHDKLILSAGIRYGVVTGSDVPLMPSFDILFIPLKTNNTQLSLRAAASGGSKVPSLNDRYWGGVHSYLKSESSRTAESGLNLSWFRGRTSLDLFVTVYASEVQDWIRWLPAGSVWRPQNVPEVRSRGGEAGLMFTASLGEWNLRSGFNYNNTNVVMKKSLRPEDPSVGHQLAYQPKHSLRASFTADKEPFSLFVRVAYTGGRTTLDIFDKLPAYTLTDIGASVKIKLHNYNFSINATILNLFDTSYQNVKFYAMPKRHGQVSVRWNF